MNKRSLENRAVRCGLGIFGVRLFCLTLKIYIMAKKQSVSSFACISPYIVRLFGLPVICACGKCKWCRDQSRKGSKELTFKRHMIITERFDNCESVGDVPS